MCGLAWLPMRRMSRKPLLVTRTIGSPLRSSKAFVATVVPIRIQPIRVVSILPSGPIAP